uniref:Uncharacterized protein n=1 Tax=Pithovirus LCPAC403 TaxID=2506596 RepID=A0A481ZFI8_9VIRU|nr:MAG: hypothetical protein LCPAC403_03750 [Pithovirus LCPAC403]
MTSSVLELVGELNKVFAYYTLDEYNIMGCCHFANKLGISGNCMLTTRCYLTSKTLIHLFGATRGEEINELSDNCIVELECEEDFDPITHTFLYSGGYMYHSYATEYSLKQVKIDKADISKILNEFSDFPNPDAWEKLTEIKVPNLTGKCYITIHNLAKCDPNQIKINAIILINNALQALATGGGKYHYDDYTYILSLDKSGDDYIINGIEYLNDLLSKIV